MQIEGERRRERSTRWAARTLDLDLILFGNQILNESDLVIPHPRFRERAFVLQPLAEIAPELVDPVTGLTVLELWKKLRVIRI
jgi:2-amino-4-hydroxy-6-hydroxymethyldihydropteridine diphosphokinase